MNPQNEKGEVQYKEEECCQHEWILHSERDELEWPFYYYRCQLCGEETDFLPKLENVFIPE